MKKFILAFAIVTGALVHATATNTPLIQTFSYEPIEFLDPLEVYETIAQYPVAVVDFYADWCAPCRKMGPIYEEVAYELADLETRFFKVNIGDHRGIWGNFGIRTIPTIIVFKEGKEAFRSGSISKEALREVVISAQQ